MKTTKEILIIDGYNVINAWPELTALKEVNLEHARDKLVEILAGYGAYNGYQIIVVYDAHYTDSPSIKIEKYGHVEVVYTDEGETADSYIEKLSYQMVRQGGQVYVVTSDWAEQRVILGVGAYRISSRELWRRVDQFNKNIGEKYLGSSGGQRHELSNRVNDDIMKRLEEIRRSNR